MSWRWAAPFILTTLIALWQLSGISWEAALKGAAEKIEKMCEDMKERVAAEEGVIRGTIEVLMGKERAKYKQLLSTVRNQNCSLSQ
jgi:hypothetical protein